MFINTTILKKCQLDIMNVGLIERKKSSRHKFTSQDTNIKNKWNNSRKHLIIQFGETTGGMGS